MSHPGNVQSSIAPISPALPPATGQPILHADADAFFASVEVRDRPELADRPFVVIAGSSGVVACPNYPARAHGIHGGMTIRQAKGRCSNLALVESRFDAYAEASERLFQLFARYAVAIEPGSMEEAFLDVAGDDPVTVAGRIRTEASDEIGLPVSVGVGRTKLIAKLASRRAKPDGLVVIRGDDERQLRDRLRIADLWGVGATTRERLCDLGIYTVRDLDGVQLPQLAQVVGVAMARRLANIALGTDDAAVHAPKPGRLISGERTVTPASRSRARIDEILSAATDSAVQRLTGRGQLASRIEVTVRFDDHHFTTVRTALPVPTDDDAVIHRAASDLLGRTGFADDGRGVYRVGVVLTLYRSRLRAPSHLRRGPTACGGPLWDQPSLW